MLGSCHLSAQKATQEALQGACACLEGSSMEGLTGDFLSARIDSCLQEGLYVNLSGVLREQGASLNNDSSLFALAQYLQQALTRDCAGFRQIAKGLAAEQLTEVKATHQRSSGILYQLNTNQQFPVFVLLTEEDKLEQFLWLREFDGSTRFMQGLQPYLYTKVDIVWQDTELYDGVTNRYIYYQEVLLIEETEKIDKATRKAWVKRYERSSKRKD